MALITLLCYGDAPSPEQRSALRAIQHPLNTHKIISACSGDRLAHQSDALERGAMPRVGRWGGAFPPSAAMVVTVFCSLPEQHGPLFPVEPRPSGYRQKALVSSKTILALYRGRDIEMKEKRSISPLRRNAIYLSKKQVVLMPRWCLVCPAIYGTYSHSLNNIIFLWHIVYGVSYSGLYDFSVS